MSQLEKIAERLNQECRCVTLKSPTPGSEVHALLEKRPHLFSQTTTYISSQDFNEIHELIQVIEKILAPESGPRGVFMGYDFHVTPEGPRLIEINTNAGGAYLNLILARSQATCRPDEGQSFEHVFPLERLEEKFFETFQNEWRLSGKSLPLKNIAIVDDRPEEQYLSPEFDLFRHLFENQGLGAFILAPDELEYREDGLYFQDTKIDFIYNRLTDFSLKEENHKKIHEAWKKDLVVLSPTPLHHAAFADKRQLVRLSDTEALSNLKLSERESFLIKKMIPKTRLADQTMWSQRKNLFFKPFDGFGSRAAYRGDKLTSRVWEEILKGQYVAQEIVPPGIRCVAGKESSLKVDIRAYSYQGEILLLAARLYEGQTTNFRTAGGGFSPVFVVRTKDNSL